MGTVVQYYVGGLLQMGGEPGWCFLSKSVGERLFVKGDLGVGSYFFSPLQQKWHSIPPTLQDFILQQSISQPINLVL